MHRVNKVNGDGHNYLGKKGARTTVWLATALGKHISLSKLLKFKE